MSARGLLTFGSLLSKCSYKPSSVTGEPDELQSASVKVTLLPDTPKDVELEPIVPARVCA